MVTLKSRGQIIQPTDTVELKAQFKGSDGLPADLDSFPSISIMEPSGNVLLYDTSIGVYRIDTGLYGYDFAVGLNPSIGVYSDLWSGTLDCFTVSGEFNFVVHNTQMPFVNTDGYVALGDDPGYCYSQNAIMNINKCIKLLKARLNSSGKSRSTDDFGNPIYIDCDIFDIDSLVAFLQLSLDMFNGIPYFTQFTFDDSEIIEFFRAEIVQGAVITALSSKALIERGREFNISDNGVSFVPPMMSELLNSQYGTELQNHFERIKIIKANMRPIPSGLGSLTITTRHPALARLRFLRARQFI